MAASPLTGLYRGPRNLNLAVVLRFSVDAVSVQRAQNGFGWEGIWEERWAVAWAEYLRRRNHVRRCRHLRRIYADTFFRSLVKASPSASRSLSTAGSYGWTCIWHHIRKPISLSLEAIEMRTCGRCHVHQISAWNNWIDLRRAGVQRCALPVTCCEDTY